MTISLAELPEIDLELAPNVEPLTGIGFELRSYQKAADEEIEKGWKRFQRQFAVLPTGTGKTVLFSAVTLRHVKRGQKVLILAHTDELLVQAADKLYRSTGLESAREKAEDYAHPSDMVVVSSIQTLSKPRRLSGWARDHFGLIIVDECHRALAKSYQTIFEHFETARVLGVTATPDRGDKRCLSQFFENVAYTYGLLDAVMEGYLVPLVARTIPLKIDLRGVRTERTSNGSDYSRSEVGHRIAPFLCEIAKQIRVEAPERRTMIFMPGIETSRMMAEALRAEGFAADFVSGECRDRKEKVTRFIRGETQVLCNAQLLTEGFDCPEVDCVVVLRATKIRSLYCQMVGRGTRPLEGVIHGLKTREERLNAIAKSAKPNLLILDFLWLTEKLDLVRPVHLVAKNQRVADMMLEKAADSGANGDLLTLQEDAERDLLARLAEEVRKNSKKKRRTIDPLAFSVSVKDSDLIDYEPSSRWEAMPPTDTQLRFLEKEGVDISKVQYRGYAQRLIAKIDARNAQGLCSLKQMTFLEKMKIPGAAFMRAGEAGYLIGQRMRKFRRR